jgi:organic hydroperoxide reductase OsmC/OhrA
MLEMAHFEPEQLSSVSDVVIDKDGNGFAITSVHLSVVAKIPGIDQATFQSIAVKAKAGCPVSKLMDGVWSGAVRRTLASCSVICRYSLPLAGQSSAAPPYQR